MKMVMYLPSKLLDKEPQDHTCIDTTEPILKLGVVLLTTHEGVIIFIVKRIAFATRIPDQRATTL